MTATEKRAFREAFFQKAGPNLRSALAMIDTIPGAAFYVKDALGRFVAANRRNLDVCGIATEEEIIGLTSADVFPAPLAREYIALDRRVRESGEPAVNVTDSPTGDYSTDRLVKSVFPVWANSDLPDSDLQHSYARARDGAHGGGEGQHSDLRDSYAGARDGAHGGGEVSEYCKSEFQPECIGTMCVFHQTPAQEAVPAWHGRLRTLTAWITSHCGEKITVPELARRVGTTPKGLESAFRIVLGTSVSGFVSAQRLSRARRLLETTDKTIADIAAECGYCDHSHFIKAFRARWGRPPGDYRAATRSATAGNKGK